MNKDEHDSDFDIIDQENYTPEAEHQFSHQQLVMKCMNKCIEAGCVEMRPGYFNIKTDNSGQVNKTYVEDTRKKFIECVETVETIMQCDLDETATAEIDKIKENLKEKFKKLYNEESNDWMSCPVSIRRNRLANGICFREGYLNIKLPYYQDYIEEQVKTARLILRELTKLTERINFYVEVGLTM